MATETWIKQCLERRQNNNKFTVTGVKGSKHELGGQDTVQRFFFGLCPSCYKIEEHSACSGCLMVSYCSRECQKKHWKQHKDMCKALTKIRGSNTQHLFHNDPSAQPRVTKTLEITLRRQLSQMESDILTHARICLVCHNADQKILKNCSLCHCVAYCSDECKREDQALHKTVCPLLDNCIKDYRFQMINGDKLKCYLPPRMPKLMLPEKDFESMFAKNCEGLFSLSDSAEYKKSQVRQLTYTYTCPATVLHACHMSGVANNESLVIHIVGARTAEVDDAPAWSLITAYLPNVKSLTLVMIGPELGGDDLPTSFTFKADMDTVIKYMMVKADYRSYAKSKQYKEPDLVAALNCGFIFYTSWDSSLDPMLRTTGAPLVFTEYYQQDCQLNLEKLQKNTKKKLAVIQDPSPNPFCSRYAARIPAGFGLRKYGRKNILMSNDFICIVKCFK